MPFGAVNGISRGIGVLDENEDCQKGRGSFGGKCGAQWDFLHEGRRCGSLILNAFSR